MVKIDGRTLDHATLEHLRKLAVQRVLAGEKPSAVAKSLGFYRTSIYKWLCAHKKGGEAQLQSHKAAGPEPKLTDQQCQQVRRWIIGRDPRQYSFDFGLWTRQIVATMIAERFGVTYSLPGVGVLLTRLDTMPFRNWTTISG